MDDARIVDVVDGAKDLLEDDLRLLLVDFALLADVVEQIDGILGPLHDQNEAVKALVPIDQLDHAFMSVNAKESRVKKCQAKTGEIFPKKFFRNKKTCRDLPKHEGDFLRDGMTLDLLPAFHFFAHDAFNCNWKFISNSPPGIDHSAATNANDAIGLVEIQEGLL